VKNILVHFCSDVIQPHFKGHLSQVRLRRGRCYVNIKSAEAMCLARGLTLADTTGYVPPPEQTEERWRSIRVLVSGRVSEIGQGTETENVDYTTREWACKRYKAGGRGNRSKGASTGAEQRSDMRRLRANTLQPTAPNGFRSRPRFSRAQALLSLPR
jgi:hypothetical protein